MYLKVIHENIQICSPVIKNYPQEVLFYVYRLTGAIFKKDMENDT